MISKRDSSEQFYKEGLDFREKVQPFVLSGYSQKGVKTSLRGYYASTDVVKALPSLIEGVS